MRAAYQALGPSLERVHDSITLRHIGCVRWLVWAWGLHHQTRGYLTKRIRAQSDRDQLEKLCLQEVPSAGRCFSSRGNRLKLKWVQWSTDVEQVAYT